jgi:hypothetical protein
MGKSSAPGAFARRCAQTGRTPSRRPKGHRKPLFIWSAPGRLPTPRSATDDVSATVSMKVPSASSIQIAIWARLVGVK